MFLIDGNNLINRTFYGVPSLSSSSGFPTNAIYGFITSLLRILEVDSPSHIIVAFDYPDKTFRHEIYPEYKGNRGQKPEEFKIQIPVLKELLIAMNIGIIEMEGFEADDIIGSLSNKAENEGFKVIILSGDRDLFQLVTNNVIVRFPRYSRGNTEITEYDFTRINFEYGITPSQITDLKGLMGDSSDNIPGIPKIGEKTALKLLQTYHSLENVIEHSSELTPKSIKETVIANKDLGILSKMLATIRRDLLTDIDFDDYIVYNVYTNDAISKLEELEIYSLYTKFIDMKGSDFFMNVIIYTDGAARGNPGGPGGYGVILKFVDSRGIEHRSELSQGYKETTNNRMELMAAIRGLMALKTKAVVDLYSDSTYLVNGFEKGWVKSWQSNQWKTSTNKPVKNQDLWKALVTLTKIHIVKFHWVKGHSSNQDNNRCDELATMAADSKNLIDDIQFHLPDGFANSLR